MQVRQAQGIGDPFNIGKYVGERHRLQRHDPRLPAGPGADRGLDIGQADRADLALVLGDDDVGRAVGERPLQDFVDGRGVGHGRLHLGVDLGAAAGQVQTRGRADGQGFYSVREVALVGPSHQPVRAAQRRDDFRRTRQQRDHTLHFSILGRFHQD